MKEVEIQEHFNQLSIDIRSLFPSIPIKPTLTLIHEKLQNDKLLKDRTKWQPKNMVNLIQKCTKETHFKDFEVTYRHRQMVELWANQFLVI